MKKILFMMCCLLIFIFSSCDIDETIKVNVHNLEYQSSNSTSSEETSSNKTVTYTIEEGQYLEIAPTYKSGFILKGYFDSNKVQYCDSYGKSLNPWKKGNPSDLYPIYIQEKGSSYTFNDYDGVTITLTTATTGNGSEILAFKIPNYYQHHFEMNKSLKVTIDLSFDHYEEVVKLLGANTFSNWANCTIYSKESSNAFSTSKLESNSGFKKFKFSKTILSSNLGDAIYVKIERPMNNLSTANCQYKNFETKFTISNGSINVKDSYTSSANGDLKLGNLYGRDKSEKIPFPDDLMTVCEEYKNDDSVVLNVSITLSHYGSKALFFSNWVDYQICLENTDKILAKGKFESNNEFKNDIISFKISSSDFDALSDLVIKVNYPLGNVSNQNYEIKNINAEFKLQFKDTQ